MFCFVPPVFSSSLDLLHCLQLKMVTKVLSGLCTKKDICADFQKKKWHTVKSRVDTMAKNKEPICRLVLSTCQIKERMEGLSTSVPDSCSSRGDLKTVICCRFGALVDERIANMLKLLLVTLKEHYVCILPFLITFGNCLLTTLQLSEIFG